MIEKAQHVMADGVIFDLEDAVSLSEKEQARENVKNAISSYKGIKKEWIVRVNGMDTAFGIRDILAMAQVWPDALIVPKADEASLIIADRLLTVLEREAGVSIGSVGLVPLIETTAGIVRIDAILGVTPRINGVQLGAEDLTKEQGITRTQEGLEIQHARCVLAMAACAHGIDIFDTPFTGIDDLEGLRKDTVQAREIGFTGKTCIHPKHIEIINDVFSPEPEVVDRARRLVEAFDAAVREGKGACMFEGKMVDPPIAERAKKIIEKDCQIRKNA
jgi:citrate lyase subunit beta/citryl-CoA lyase